MTRLIVFILLLCVLVTGCAFLKSLGRGAADTVGGVFGDEPPPEGAAATDWVEWVVRIGGLIGWSLYGKKKLDERKAAIGEA